MCLSNDSPGLQHRVFSASQDRIDLAREPVQLINAEVEIPALIREPPEHLEIAQIVDASLHQLEREPPDRIIVIALFVDAVTRQESQDRCF